MKTINIIDTDGNFWDEPPQEVNYCDAEEPIVLMGILMTLLLIVITLLVLTLVCWPIIVAILLTLGKLTFLGSLKMALVAGGCGVGIFVISIITYFTKEC